MATERQIAANRRNAGKSTGPRSRAGKQRARGNAYQYGLTTGLISSAALARKIEKLARKIAGNSKDEISLVHARSAAYAEFDLARVRRVRVALIERAYAGGSLGASRPFISERPDAAARDAAPFLSTIVQGETPFKTTAEAIRNVLPELLKLDRYESRAAARRDRAIRQMVKNRSRGAAGQNS